MNVEKFKLEYHKNLILGLGFSKGLLNLSNNCLKNK
jgi:hypothetical protein